MNPSNINVIKAVVLGTDVAQGESCAIAQQQKRVDFSAGTEPEVARHMQHRELALADIAQAQGRFEAQEVMRIFALPAVTTLDEYLTSTGYRVTPFVGVIDPGWTPRPDPSEAL